MSSKPDGGVAVNVPNDATQQEALRQYRKGRAIVYVRAGAKAPEQGWTDEAYVTEDEVRLRFPATDPEHVVEQPNLGIRLGRDSGGLVVVDIDHADPAIATMVLPPTQLRDGRPGRPNSHWFYRVKGRFPKVHFASPALGGKHLFEILGDGQQVVFAPSFYAEYGEYRRLEADGEPTEVDADELVRRVGVAAALNEVALLWDRHKDHHDSALEIAGGLLRGGVEPETVEDFLSYLWPSRERNEVENIVTGTVAKLEADQPVTGWPSLRKRWGDGIGPSITKIGQWLGVKDVDPSDPRPRVHLSTSEGEELVRRTWAALEEANDPPSLFQHGGKLARVNLVKVRQKGASEDGGEKLAPAIELLTLDSLRAELGRLLLWVGYDKKSGQPKKANPPLDVLRLLLGQPSERIPLPVVSRVVGHPVFGPDGTLRTESGYHPGSQTYLWLDRNLELRPVPSKPTKADMEEAKRLIFDELLVDFPFVVDVDGVSPSRAHALALGLLPFGRDLVDGYTPFHIVEAPTPGTGKDLLIKALAQVWNGKSDVASMPQTGDEEEWRKLVISKMREGSGFFYVANIKGDFRSAVLEGAISEGTVTGRIMRTQDMVTGEVQFIWLGTANNAVVGEDLGRRMVPIRLDAQTSRPSNRRGFKHVLPDWAGQHRSDLVWAFLTLWQNWLATGQPRGNHVMGSFQNWAEVMGGVLEAAGVDGFLGNLQEFQDAAVDEDAEWKEFVSLWLLAYGTQKVKPSQLVAVAEQVEGFPLGNAKDANGKAGVLSKLLKAQRDRFWDEGVADGTVKDNLRLVMVKDTRTGRNLFHLQTKDRSEREPLDGFWERFEGPAMAPSPRGFGR